MRPSPQIPDHFSFQQEKLENEGKGEGKEKESKVCMFILESTWMFFQ